MTPHNGSDQAKLRTEPIIHTECKGPNRDCRAAYRAGRTVHVIPPNTDAYYTVLPTYHFVTEAEALAASAAVATAPIVRTDADLYRYRAEGVAYRVPADGSFIDPSRR